MSTKSPLSTICLVAWAKRTSSRSIGGMVKKPGRNSTRQVSVRNRIARHWLAVANSNAMNSLRLECAGFTDCCPAPKRRGWRLSTMGFAYDETAAQTTVQFRFPVASLHPDHDGIGGAGGVDHGQARKAGPGRVDQALAAAVDVPG